MRFKKRPTLWAFFVAHRQQQGDHPGAKDRDHPVLLPVRQNERRNVIFR